MYKRNPYPGFPIFATRQSHTRLATEAVMAGLVPAIHAMTLRYGPRTPTVAAPFLHAKPSRQVVVKIAPVGVHVEDQSRLPGARPVLHIAFPLDRVANVFVTLKPDETLQAVSFGEAVDPPFAMLPSPARQIIRDAGVESSVRPVRHDVDPSAARGLNLHGVDGRHNPRIKSGDGHDGVWSEMSETPLAPLAAPALIRPSLTRGPPSPTSVRRSRARCRRGLCWNSMTHSEAPSI